MPDDTTPDTKEAPAPAPAPAPAVQSSSGPSSSTSFVSQTNGGRTIFGLLAFATLFSVVGNEIAAVQKAKSVPQAVNSFVTEGGRIIVGGTLATAFLLLVSHAGRGGETFAVGLALVTAASSMLVFGAPVWRELNTAFGTSGTTPAGLTPTVAPTTGAPSTTRTGATK